MLQYNLFEKWNLIWERETLLRWIKVENVPIIIVMNTPNPWFFHQKGSSCHKQSGHRWGPAQIQIGWKRGTFRECPRGCRCQTRSSNDAPVVTEWETFQLIECQNRYIYLSIYAALILYSKYGRADHTDMNNLTITWMTAMARRPSSAPLSNLLEDSDMVLICSKRKQ